MSDERATRIVLSTFAMASLGAGVFLAYIGQTVVPAVVDRPNGATDDRVNGATGSADFRFSNRCDYRFDFASLATVECFSGNGLGAR